MRIRVDGAHAQVGDLREVRARLERMYPVCENR